MRLVSYIDFIGAQFDILLIGKVKHILLSEKDIGMNLKKRDG